MADITGSITKIRTSDNSEHYINAKYWDGHEWGELASALKYCGITTTKLTDGATTNPVVIGDTNHTATAGCVVFYEDTEGGKSTTKEFVFNGSKWELLGADSTYKVIQSTVSSPNADGSAMAFIDTISQDANGVITVTKKYCKKQYRLEYTATGSLGYLYPCDTNSVLHEYDTSTGKGVFVYDEAPTSIESEAFNACSSLTSITIPDSVTEIGTMAFYDCTSLKSVIIGNSVTSIGDEAFSWCTSLTSVAIPDSVISIGESAFNNCTSLKSVTIGNGVTTIGDDAFAGCSSLTSVTIPDSVTSIGDDAFAGCTGELIINSREIVERNYIVDDSSINSWLKDAAFTKLTIGDSVTKIGGEAFRDYSYLTSVTIPNSVTTIGNDAFSGCSSLTSVTIPNSVTTIGINAFGWCKSLTSVTIPDSVTTIGMGAFTGCSSLTSVIIPDSITTIGHFVFQSCSSLTSVIIPDSVTDICEATFNNCDNLKTVYCKPTTPPTLLDSSLMEFGRMIYVPMESVDAYKSTQVWSDYADRIIGCVFEDEHLVSGENIKTINGESILGEGDIKLTSTSMVEITWVDLKKLRDNSQLIPGLQYRIIDYVTTTTQANTRSAGHQFDIIVTADTNNVLNENARACLHKGDIYFSDAGAKLESWQIKYCLDNDKDKFAWAKGIPAYKAEFVALYWDDPVNGVIYDNNNRIGGDKIYDWGTVYDPELEYDNIVIYKSDESIYIDEGADYADKYFYRGVVVVDGIEYDSWKKWDANYGGWMYSDEGLGCQYAITERIVFNNEVVWQNEKYAGRGVIYNMIDEYNNECPYDFKNIMFFREGYSYDVYTFNWISSSDDMMDASIFGNNGTLNNDEVYQCGVQGNIIKPNFVFIDITQFQIYQTKGQQILNNIVFISSYHSDNGIFIGNMRNIFGYNCCNNTIGNSCSFNIFDDYCMCNTFGNDCHFNTFNEYCAFNTFDGYCSNNTFGYACTSNILYDNCFYNTFSNDCSSNIFSDGCECNTFNANCGGNTFGSGCVGNTFGSECNYNTFGNDCEDISFQLIDGKVDNVNYVHCGDGCKYIILSVDPDVVGTINHTNSIKNIDVAQGLNFGGTVRIDLTTTGQDYEIKVARNSSGEIKVFCLADLIA